MAIKYVPRYVTTSGLAYDTLERAAFSERCDNLRALRPPSAEILHLDWLAKHAEQVIAALNVEVRDEE